LEIVNKAVRIALAEDSDDLCDVEIRQAEPSADFEDLVSNLGKSERIKIHSIKRSFKRTPDYFGQGDE
jgi:hypothetical protein